MEAMAVVASETFTSTSAPIQYAAVKAFQGSVEIERYLSHSRRILKALADWIWTRMTAAGIDVAKPDGAFYMLPDFEPLRAQLEKRGIVNGGVLCRLLLEETGVAILPGSNFGRPQNELTARLAYVNFDGAKVLAAIEQLAGDEVIGEDFLRCYCEQTLTAVERLCEWVR